MSEKNMVTSHGEYLLLEAKTLYYWEKLLVSNFDLVFHCYAAFPSKAE